MDIERSHRSKWLLLLVWTTLTIPPLKAQIGVIPDLGITLTFQTQSEIDGFPELGYGDFFIGDIVIMDDGDEIDPITNLDGLSSLTLLFGNLDIIGNTQLESFCGLYPLFGPDENTPGGLVGTYTAIGNLINPTIYEIVVSGPCVEEEIILTFDELLLAYLDDGLLNWGQINALSRQAEKSNKGLLNHLNALVNASILTEDEAMMLYNASIL